MDIHYNAFISYRHHPDDIKVAMDIHRGLERFKIPKAIKKRCGSSMRLFRDKEELPITSSLTSDIYRALENSDYLIVICSPHTKESIWVQREIETFLRTHTRDQVLTVLASGDPYDVLPEILLHEDVVNPITGEIQRHEYEPLSCDWRLKKRRAVREELPRLAAALLGCGYDELRQRQRQYRMRRMITLFSAALMASLSLTAYFIHTSIQIQKANDDLHAANVQIQAANVEIRQANVQIQENLDQALQNQSEYLASAAGERMDAGDRLTAISLALAALPTQENPRPYVPEAERALSEALSSYEAEYQVIAQGAFPADALVRQYIVSDDGLTLVILDARMMLTVWDTETFQKCATVNLDAYSVNDILFTASGNILIVTSDLLLCYQPEGTLLWQAEHCVDMAFLDDRSKVLMIQSNYGDLRQYSVLDADTGVCTASVPIVNQELDSMPIELLQSEGSSQRPVLVRYFSGNTYLIYLLDLQTGAVRKVTDMDTSLSGDNHSVDYAALDNEGNVILMRGDGSGIYNGNYGTFQITSPDRADLICYDAKTMKVKWQSEITNYIYSSSRTIQPVPDSNLLLIQSGDVIQIHDSATGKKISQCQLPAIPLHLTVEAEVAWGITQNGAYFQYKYADNRCNVTPFTDSSLDGAIVNRGYFVHVPLESHVTVYRSMKDPSASVYAGEVDSVLRTGRISGNYMLDWTGNTLYMFDTGSKTLLWSQELDFGWKLLGFSKDSTRLWMVKASENCIAEFSSQTGARTDRSVRVSIEDSISILDSEFFFCEDALMYIVKADGLTQLQRVDLSTGEKNLLLDLKELSREEMDYTANTRFIYASDAYAWILQGETVYVIDLKTGAVQQLLEGISTKPACAENASRRELLVAAGSKLLLTDPNGTILHTIELGDKKGVSVFFYDDQLMVLCDDGCVYRYDRTGTLLSRTTLELYDTFFSSVASSIADPMDIHWWQTDDGDLIIKAFHAGNIIDCSRWQSRAFIPHLYTYISQTDEIVCFAEYQFHAYPRYTTQEQMAKAQEALGDFTLSEELLKFYGLN